jgi:hypothetical protein
VEYGQRDPGERAPGVESATEAIEAAVQAAEAAGADGADDATDRDPETEPAETDAGVAD